MRPFLPLFFAAALAVTGAACSSRQRIETEKALAEALVSDEQEMQLGLQVKQELQKEGVRYLEDPEVNAYVSRIWARLRPHADKDRPEVKWHVHVVDDNKVVNAFATPGGHLYVYSGLLLAADNEAEVAGVLAHEAGHVVGRHSARQMVNAYGLSAVASMALGQNPGLLKQVAATVVGKGLMLKHGRGEELEADEMGVRYTSAAGYDPRGLISFFQKLAAKEGKVPGILTMLSSHPPTPERIARAERLIAENQLKGGDVGADRLAPIKQRLASRGGTPVGQR